MIIDETDLPGPLEDALVAELAPLLTDAAHRDRMAQCMRRLACPDAASNVSEAICRIVCGASARLAA